MEKVKITQEQADEITYHLQLHTPFEMLQIWRGEISSNWADRDGMKECVSAMTENDFIRAVYTDFEVEETPEDKLREYYGKLNKGAIERDREKFGVNQPRHEMQGILTALTLLNIKIEGIN